MFGLGFVFAHQIQSGIREMQQWFAVVLGATLAVWLSYRFYEGRKRAGLPVGPPVLFDEEPPLPFDDLHAWTGESQRKSESQLGLKSSLSMPPGAALAASATCLPVAAPGSRVRDVGDPGPSLHAAELPTGTAAVDVGSAQTHSRTSLGS